MFASVLLLSLGAAPSLQAAPSRPPLFSVRAIDESGPHIKRLQKALAKAGYDPGTIDGIYGKATDVAVKQYLADREAEKLAKAQKAAPTPGPRPEPAEEPEALATAAEPESE
ncbi:MAG: peptidoglycan-binding protein, partial [Myxococcota bacterium]|nr:peptidoglycan-binding protein [Myxococcota bacterium]